MIILQGCKLVHDFAAYRLYTVMPRLVKFVEQLTNWYVRMNRKRLKGDTGVDDCHEALTTLFGILFSMCKVMVSILGCFISQLFIIPPKQMCFGGYN